MAQRPRAVRSRWKQLWAASAIVAVGLVSLDIHPVQLSIASPQGITRQSTWTWHQTWAGTLSQLGVRVGAHDGLSRPLGASSAEPLTIRRAVEVTVATAHHHYRLWTTRYRVGAILAALDIHVSGLDIVDPGQASSVAGGARIEVVRRRFVTTTEITTLPFATQYRPDPNMFAGQRAVLSNGQNGSRLERTRTLYADGQPVRATLLGAVVNHPAVNRVVLYGTLDTVSRGGQVVYFSREITMVATAYWPDPAWSSGYTATGARAQYGVVAVDPAVIPLGTHLYIPGYGFAVAADTGGAIVGHRIDLCYDTAWQANDWGVRTVDVFVVKPAP